MNDRIIIQGGGWNNSDYVCRQALLVQYHWFYYFDADNHGFRIIQVL